MAEIPEELIVKILLLLPVVALLRFRCVSKKWRDIIDSPDFVKSHLNLSNNKKAHSLMIFCEKTWHCCVEFDLVFNDSSPPIFKELTRPWRGDVCKYFGAVGVCNGLLCLNTIGFGVVLWNPSTRKHLQFPLPQQLDEFVIWCWGFGCDSDSDDYKVVCIACAKSGNDNLHSYVVWVYSLKSGLWKRIGDFPYARLGFWQQGFHLFRLHRQRSVFVNGALHWKVYSQPAQDRCYLVVALDLGKLEYNSVPLPDFTNDTYHLRLGVINGCLSANYWDYRSQGFDLWVMQEYGVKESWTRFITCTGYTTLLTPLAYTENGNDLVFVTPCNEMVRYEFETRSFKQMTHCWPPVFCRAFVYMPSLVCPRSGVCSGDS